MNVSTISTVTTGLVAGLLTLPNAAQGSTSSNAASTAAIPAVFALSPDNGQDLVVDAIRQATRTLTINIYQFDSLAIRAEVLAAIQRGVKTRILIEGDPVGGMSNSGKETLALLLQSVQRSSTSGGSVFLMTKKGGSGVHRRYAYDHAKYMVVDGAKALVTSENWTDTGQPQTGLIGNRGWHAWVSDAGLAQQLEALFVTDTDTQFGDVLDLTQTPIPSAFAAQPGSSPRKPAHRTVAGIARQAGSIDRITLATSPDSTAAIAQFIRLSTAKVDLEFMTLPLTWKDSGQQNPYMNPIVAELVKAGRDGQTVRVLLNDENSFASKSSGDPTAIDPTKPEPAAQANTRSTSTKNLETACALIELSRNENLKIDARIIDITEAGITYIHNKGILTDNKYSWISSINGTRNSVMNNRETAIAIESTDAATYFGQAFSQDWGVSSAIADSDCAGLVPANSPIFRSLNAIEMRLASLFFRR